MQLVDVGSQRKFEVESSQKVTSITVKPKMPVKVIQKTKKPSIYYKEKGITLIRGDCLEVLRHIKPQSIDLIFADPPYNLSNGGITCHAGKMVSVNKGKWDVSNGLEKDHEFNLNWLRECQRILKPNGTIWVSGTLHVIYSVGFAMQQLRLRILNDIAWYKPNAAPNLSCRYFTHSHEILLWASKDKKARHKFNYQLMKRENNGKQMRSVWEIPTPKPYEKKFGKHPTQKPLALLERIIRASSNKGDLVLDPFIGSGTTAVAAKPLGRKCIGIDQSEEFLNLAIKRLRDLEKNVHKRDA